MNSKLFMVSCLFSACLSSSVFAQEEAQVPTPSEDTESVDLSGYPPIVVPSSTQRQPPVVPQAQQTQHQPSAQLSSDGGSKLAFGMQMSLGVPDIASAALVVSPWLPWMKLDIGGAFDGLNGGVVGGLSIDPIDFIISPTLTLDAGGFFPGTIPGVSKSPSIAYTFEDVLAGLELGKRSGFKLFLRGGVAHMDVSADNLSKAFTLPNGAAITGASASVWAPAAKLGFNLMF
jgi:hypothetical protein